MLPRPVPDARAGTGLSLCLAFVRQHGGKLDIESEPGVGTTVRVTLLVGKSVLIEEEEADLVPA